MRGTVECPDRTKRLKKSRSNHLVSKCNSSKKAGSSQSENFYMCQQEVRVGKPHKTLYNCMLPLLYHLLQQQLLHHRASVTYCAPSALLASSNRATSSLPRGSLGSWYSFQKAHTTLLSSINTSPELGGPGGRGKWRISGVSLSGNSAKSGRAGGTEMSSFEGASISMLELASSWIDELAEIRCRELESSEQSLSGPAKSDSGDSSILGVLGPGENERKLVPIGIGTNSLACLGSVFVKQNSS
jgi:hypothetical protein